MILQFFLKNISILMMIYELPYSRKFIKKLILNVMYEL